MKILTLSLALGLASPAVAAVNVDIGVSFPAPPPLVLVSPGVQIVPDLDHEVFFVDGFYWSRGGAGWYRTADYRGGWVLVDAPRVPVTIVQLPPGHYKRWKAPKPREKVVVKIKGKGRGHGRHK